MRLCICAISLALLLTPVSIWRASAQGLPACNTQVVTRHGNAITIGLQQLTAIFNRDLSAAHSNFSDLQLSADGANRLKVSGKNNGSLVSISGPLEPAGNGALKLHADKIVKNGAHEKGLMSLTGKDLADYAHFKNTQSLSAQGNDIYIHPDPLLNLSGTVTGVSLNKSNVTLTFSSMPCK